MFRIAEIELGMENTIGITLETGVGVQTRNAILHVCPQAFWPIKCPLVVMIDRLAHVINFD